MAEDYTDPVIPLAGVVSGFREDISAPINWEVTGTPGEFGAGVDFVAGILAVPLEGDRHSQQVQLRQIVELRCSPTDPAIYKHLAKHYKDQGITENILRAAESARISAITEKFAKQFDLTREPDGSEKTRGKNLASAGTAAAWDQAVEFTLRYNGTKSFDSFASGIRSVNPEWSKQLRNLSKRLSHTLNGTARSLGDTSPFDYGDGITGPMGFSNTVYTAGVVREYLSDGYKAPNDMQRMREAREEKRAQNYGKVDPKDISNDGHLTPQQMPLEDDVPDGFEFPDDSDFGKLRVCDTLPLTVEVAGYMHRKRKAMTSGRRIAYPSRMLTDPQRRVFGTKVRVKGGIVVVDISGSMSLTQDDIEAIVTAAPAAVIIAYSDCNDDPNPNAWVLANRGWRVKDIGHIGGQNNGVDGPALTWAIRHQHRNEDIVWITDGMVTGISGGSYNIELAKQCAKLVKKHKIIMIPSVEEAVKQFKAGRFVNKPAGRVREALLGRL